MNSAVPICQHLLLYRHGWCRRGGQYEHSTSEGALVRFVTRYSSTIWIHHPQATKNTFKLGRSFRLYLLPWNHILKDISKVNLLQAMNNLGVQPLAAWAIYYGRLSVRKLLQSSCGLQLLFAFCIQTKNVFLTRSNLPSQISCICYHLRHLKNVNDRLYLKHTYWPHGINANQISSSICIRISSVRNIKQR